MGVGWQPATATLFLPSKSYPLPQSHARRFRYRLRRRNRQSDVRARRPGFLCGKRAREMRYHACLHGHFGTRRPPNIVRIRPVARTRTPDHRPGGRAERNRGVVALRAGVEGAGERWRFMVLKKVDFLEDIKTRYCPTTPKNDF